MKKKIFVVVAYLSVLVGIIVLNKSAGITERGATRNVEKSDLTRISSQEIPLSSTPKEMTALRSMAISTLESVNKKRKEAGLKELIWDNNLENAATIRATESAILFSHTRPDNTPWYTVNDTIMYGENLAYGYNSADAVINAWLNSTTHKENILCSDFKTMGISIYVSNNGTYYWAQEFGY